VTWVPPLVLCVTVVGAEDTATDAHGAAAAMVYGMLLKVSRAALLLASRAHTLKYTTPAAAPGLFQL